MEPEVGPRPLATPSALLNWLISLEMTEREYEENWYEGDEEYDGDEWGDENYDEGYVGGGQEEEHWW